MKKGVQVVEDKPQKPGKGTVGLNTQLPGRATTTGNAASATGGIGRGKFIETDK